MCYQCVQGGNQSVVAGGRGRGEGEERGEVCEQRGGDVGDVGVEVSWEVKRRWLWLWLGGSVKLCWRWVGEEGPDLVCVGGCAVEACPARISRSASWVCYIAVRQGKLTVFIPEPELNHLHLLHLHLTPAEEEVL